jgi:hypothetical protein
VADTLAPPPQPGSRRTPERACLNCGDPTPGNYCPNCGQRKLEVRVSLRRMFMEALDDQFSLNSALPRTLGALFLHPGRLTRDYMDGRIARYIPPFRLYLISSLAFFLILSFDLRYRSGNPEGLRVRSDTTRSAGVPARTFASSRDSLAAGADSSRAGRDSAGERNWLRGMRFNSPWAELDSTANRRLRELGAMEPEEGLKRVGGQFLEYVPQTMFLLMPLFAGLLKLLYIRRKRLYVEHFVFALHLHAFTFLTFVITMLVPGRLVDVAGFFWLLVYTYLAMYRVYGQGWFRTGIKYIALGIGYNILLGFALVLTLLAAVVLM